MQTASSPSRRPRERVDRRAARAPRREPQQRWHAQRRHQPDGVPVAERLAQAGEGLVGREPLGEHLGHERPAAHEHAAEADAVEHRCPAIGHEPHEREPSGQGGDVGERAIGLEPRVGGRQRPVDRQRGVERERRQREQRQPAVQRRREPPGDQCAGHQRGARQHHRHLGPGRALEPQAAVRSEGDGGDRDPDRPRSAPCRRSPAGRSRARARGRARGLRLPASADTSARGRDHGDERAQAEQDQHHEHRGGQAATGGRVGEPGGAGDHALVAHRER